ncbi:MAG: undecaprenyl-phosphate galactose phosphotransferase WbaP [Lentisphaerae bacterium]|nr:undecaprenyl-phosphate galactose phosphotransferase WbaP [Lentisphaerota bacterium]MCP4102640.1 undecaprenyl-phosphate galactose phosphotransferase WbaP [Lentisphaerota bacterium]
MKIYIRMLLLLLGDFTSFMGTLTLIALFAKLFNIIDNLDIYFQLWPFSLLFLGINEISRLYHGSLVYPGVCLGAADELRRIFYSVTSIFVGIIFFIIITGNAVNYSNVVFIINWPICIIAVISCRWILRHFFKKYEGGYVKAVILGAGINGTKIAKVLNENKYLGITPVAFLDDNCSLHESEVEGIPVVGSLCDIQKTAQNFNINYVIACLPVKTVMEKIDQLCKGFKHVMIVPTSSMFSSTGAYAHDLDGILGLEIRYNLAMKSFQVLKLFFDYTFALVVVVFALPIMILCAISIKVCSKGPIIYKSKRLGLEGKTFYVYKFRTMRMDANKCLEKYLLENPDAQKEWELSFKIKRDPRVTPIGNILRRTSLDELPQLINVLRGEMSLVGPRPIVEKEVKYYGDKFRMVFGIRPGITGLWQASGRSKLNYARRVELDCYYLMNWNIWLDLFIVLKTIKEVIFCKGAY